MTKYIDITNDAYREIAGDVADAMAVAIDKEIMSGNRRKEMSEDTKLVEGGNYYMIYKVDGQTDYWERCQANTLLGAKREATKEYGVGYIGAELVIAKGDDVTAPRIEIAKKTNAPWARWQSCD